MLPVTRLHLVLLACAAGNLSATPDLAQLDPHWQTNRPEIKLPANTIRIAGQSQKSITSTNIKLTASSIPFKEDMTGQVNSIAAKYKERGLSTVGVIEGVDPASGNHTLEFTAQGAPSVIQGTVRELFESGIFPEVRVAPVLPVKEVKKIKTELVEEATKDALENASASLSKIGAKAGDVLDVHIMVDPALFAQYGTVSERWFSENQCRKLRHDIREDDMNIGTFEYYCLVECAFSYFKNDSTASNP